MANLSKLILESFTELLNRSKYAFRFTTFSLAAPQSIFHHSISNELCFLLIFKKSWFNRIFGYWSFTWYVGWHGSIVIIDNTIIYWKQKDYKQYWKNGRVERYDKTIDLCDPNSIQTVVTFFNDSD